MNFKKTFLAVAVTVSAAQVGAAGFQLMETSVSGLGRSFAGEGVVADDASVVARNAAAMALFDKTSFSFGATYVDPGVEATGISGPDILGPDFDVSRADDDEVVPPAVIPAMYLVHPVNDKIAVGVGLNVNYGLASKFDDDYAAGSIGGETDLLAYNLNFNGSYRFNPHLSIGLGVNIVYADALLQRRAGATGQLNSLPPDFTIIKVEGDDIAHGWNAGIVYEVNQNHRFSLTFRSKVSLELKGEITGANGVKEDGSLDLELPAITEFSGFHQITNDWAFHYSVMHTDWDSFETLEGFADSDPVNPALFKEENFESSIRYAIGVTWSYSDNLTLRAGLAKDESAAVDEYRSISIPDSDRMWYNAGATYRLDKNSTIDFGLSYINGDVGTVVEEDAVLEKVPPDELLPSPLGSRDWTIKTEGNAFLIGLAYNYVF